MLCVILSILIIFQRTGNVKWHFNQRSSERPLQKWTFCFLLLRAKRNTQQFLYLYVFELQLRHINWYFSDIDIVVVRLTTLKWLEKWIKDGNVYLYVYTEWFFFHHDQSYTSGNVNRFCYIFLFRKSFADFTSLFSIFPPSSRSFFVITISSFDFETATFDFNYKSFKMIYEIYTRRCLITDEYLPSNKRSNLRHSKAERFCSRYSMTLYPFQST